jgi:hypothetical protein
MPLHQELNLARYVASRAHLSLHLVGGLRATLKELGHLDMVAVLDLVGRHAKEAHLACLAAMAIQKQEKSLRVISSLQQLNDLGGPAANVVITRLAHDLVSGSHKAFPGA